VLLTSWPTNSRAGRAISSALNCRRNRLAPIMIMSNALSPARETVEIKDAKMYITPKRPGHTVI
jgi:hypothetical protein